MYFVKLSIDNLYDVLNFDRGNMKKRLSSQLERKLVLSLFNRLLFILRGSKLSVIIEIVNYFSRYLYIFKPYIVPIFDIFNNAFLCVLHSRSGTFSNLLKICSVHSSKAYEDATEIIREMYSLGIGKFCAVW